MARSSVLFLHLAVLLCFFARGRAAGSCSRRHRGGPFLNTSTAPTSFDTPPTTSIAIETFVAPSISSSSLSSADLAQTSLSFPITITLTPGTSSTTSSTFSSVPAPSPSASSDTSSSSSTSSSDINAYLEGHNTFRAQHGAADLTWSDELAGKAQQWANGCVFKHSGGSLGSFGENLAAGTGSSYSISSAIKSWTDEASSYDPNNPVASHFTQVVWKATSQVGCAVQSCDGIFDASFGKASYYVCEYSPAGNVIGQFAENVQA
ncbi:CAP domain-containing protein [Armillaria novae-zelandiae]|uniref:CAP domain-containing protein n=1 Tax=Armillaria novae-zelandiae TaxID=153914 RepID=A0AA39UAA4_9AGAR|nr:CAP domain-containing protein [Armillaria novae-zelandiae]